ncbi:MAG TPA: hypothetical protein VF145_10365 [Chitinophagaceae bacterium]
MRLPVIKHIRNNCTPDEIETAIRVLESASEAASLKEDETNVIGELISNFCGALEVDGLIRNGMNEKDALNTFMKKVMSSIDR